MNDPNNMVKESWDETTIDKKNLQYIKKPKSFAIILNNCREFINK